MSRLTSKQHAATLKVEELWALYQELGSVHAVGARVGVTGDTVMRHLTRAGYKLNSSRFTEAEDEKIRAYYASTDSATFSLDALTQSLGRPSKHQVCRRARALGLTDTHRLKSDAVKAKGGATQRERLRTHEHPRGMKGKKSTPETKKKLSDAGLAAWDRKSEEEKSAHLVKIMKSRVANGTLAPNRKRGSWKAQWQEIGGKRCYFRSQWEVNYARYLQWLKDKNQIKEWEFEVETFWFEGVKRGTMSYLPDFKVTENDGQCVFHEIKGWMDDRSKTKIKRMAKYHPDVKLIVIDAKAYKALARKALGLVPGWE